MLKIKSQKSQNDFEDIKKLLAKYSSRVYLVGGFVRDEFLGLESKDYDIEIYDIEPKKFDKIMLDFGAKGNGKSFFVYTYKDFDLALPRTENKIGDGHKAFEVKLCNDEKLASRRRDFTINSIMKNIFTGEILDFWGGVKDLENRILKIIDEKAFKEDNLRILRAVQFVSRFDLKIDEKSLEIMKTMDINDLSKERIRLELEKFFKAKYKKNGIYLLKELNLDQKLFGVEFEDEFINLFLEHTKINNDPKLFLYDLVHFYDLNFKTIFKNLRLDNSYKIILKEPYFDDLKDDDMLKIAINKPIKDFLGANSLKIISRAKELGIYEEKIPFKVDDTGFENLSLDEKLINIEKQKANTIENFLERRK